MGEFFHDKYDVVVHLATADERAGWYVFCLASFFFFHAVVELQCRPRSAIISLFLQVLTGGFPEQGPPCSRLLFSGFALLLCRCGVAHFRAPYIVWDPRGLSAAACDHTLVLVAPAP